INRWNRHGPHLGPCRRLNAHKADTVRVLGDLLCARDKAIGTDNRKCQNTHIAKRKEKFGAEKIFIHNVVILSVRASIPKALPCDAKILQSITADEPMVIWFFV